MDNTFEKYDSSYNNNFSFDDVNTEKLDMYGVWIKKKPDSDKPVPPDLQSGSAHDESFAEDDSFSFSANFDDTAVFQEMEPLNDDPSEPLPELSFDGLDELESEDDGVINLDSFDAEDMDAESADAENEVFLEEDSFEALDLDDFFDEDSSTETEADTGSTADNIEPIDVDFGDVSDMEEVPLDDADAEAADDASDNTADLDSFSEISLDDFDDMPELSDEEDSSSSGEFKTVDDFDELDDFDDSDITEPAPTGKSGSVFDLNISDEDEKNSRQDLTEITAQNTDDDISIFDAPKEEENYFDDVQAVEEELLSENNAADTAVKAPTAAKTAAQDKSTELLLQIASEINGIKAELNSLKESISSKMIAGSKADMPIDTMLHTNEKDAEHHEQEANTGFFSDDDTDETISLTGDELNNILITADFTSEKAEDVMEQTDEYEIPEVLTDDMVEDFRSAETADSEFEKSVSEEIGTEENTADSENSAQGEQLLAEDTVLNVEALPITQLPDDLSYLDDDTIDEADKINLIDGVDIVSEEPYGVQDNIDLTDDDFDDLLVEDFEVPAEQDVPVADEESSSGTDAAADDDKPVIHEIFTDDDIPEFSAEEEEAGDDVFMETSDIPELQNDESLFGSDADVPELPEADEEEKSVAPAADSCGQKQDTLLKAAEQIIKEEQEKVVSIPVELKNEIKSVLAYMDQLLEALPEKKIEEFAKSEYFETYKHLFEELGIS